MIEPSTLKFLRELEKKNDRDRSNKRITSAEFPKQVVKDLKAMFPLVDYLRRVLS